MNCRERTAFWCMTMLAVVSLSTAAQAQTNPFTKAQVGDRIRKVEDGVDQFRNYLDNRGQDAKNRADSAKSSGATTRRQGSNSANTDARANQAKQTKDDLENAMDDLNRTRRSIAVDVSQQRYGIAEFQSLLWRLELLDRHPGRPQRLRMLVPTAGPPCVVAAREA